MLISRIFYNYRTCRADVHMPVGRAIYWSWINSTRST